MMPHAHVGVAAAVCLVACTLLSPVPATAQAPAPPIAGHTHPSPLVSAIARTGPITIDGRLDEAAWAAAEPATDFRQSEPDEGKPATQRTEVRFLFDNNAIYIGARMFDSLGAAGVRSRLARRDRWAESDWLDIIFDTFHDHLGRTVFQVNPAGVKRDALGQGASNPDQSWDAVWEAGTSIDSLGWVAELRIPLSQLRFPRDSTQMWGLQLWRYVQRLNETSMWSFWGRTESGGPARFGHLRGLAFETRRRHLELLPYAVARTSFVEPPRDNDPFNSRRESSYRLGGDLKYLLTSNITLDATFNPDFGQVEVDPAVVNLSAFETFFEEKRPFFIEGSGILGFGGFSCYFCSNVSSLSLFYTRRIGRQPQLGSLISSQHDYADIPENTTILGAAKITGRTSSGYSIGVLDALTKRETATYTNDDTFGERFTAEVEPLTNYFVGRARRDLRGGNLVVGGILTSMVRDLRSSDARERMSRHAEAAGTDFRLTWNDRRYSARGSFAVSNVSGDPDAMLRLQRSSARYFQRPDKEPQSNGLFSRSLDPDATHLRGHAGYARVAKDAGDWRWESAVNWRSPGFEVNDMAFLTRADYTWMNANVFRTFQTPTRFYRSADIIVGAQQQYNADGDLTDRQLHAFLGGQTRNYWWISTFFIRRPEVFEDRLTRGGPVVRRVGDRRFFLNLTTDTRKQLSFSTNPTYGWTDDGRHGYDANLFVTYNPMSNVSVSLGPSFSRFHSPQQFVTSYDDETATDFYGRRYVFSDLVQRTWSMNTRLNVTFTPTLSLELFAQPLIASGEYYEFKEFVRPRAVEKRPFVTVDSVAPDGSRFHKIDPDGPGPAPAFTLDTPEFNFRSLRGNAVARWEYRPGSAVFLVWQQQRQGSVPLGNFDFGRDREALFDAKPDNIFLVKFTYWMGL